MLGGYGEGAGEPASLGCLSVYLSIFPNCSPSLFSTPPSLHLVPCFSCSFSSSGLLCPLPFPPTLGAHSENTTRAWPCLARMQCHGMAPLPAQGKLRAWPAPHSPPSPWKDPLARWLAGPSGPWLPLLPLSFSGHLCLAFHTQRGLLESKVGGLPLASGGVAWGVQAGLGPLAPHHLVHPTPGPAVASQLHPRARAAMTVTVWSCPGQKRGPLRTVAPGAWAHGSRLPTAAWNGPSPLAAQACGARPSRTGSADLANTARRGRKVTSRMWAPEPPSQRLRAPRMPPALGLLWLGR